MACLIAPIFIFDVLVFLGAPVENLLLRFFSLIAPVGVTLGMPQLLAPLGVPRGCLDAFI